MKLEDTVLSEISQSQILHNSNYMRVSKIDRFVESEWSGGLQGLVAELMGSC